MPKTTKSVATMIGNKRGIVRAIADVFDEEKKPTSSGKIIKRAWGGKPVRRSCSMTGGKDATWTVTALKIIMLAPEAMMGKLRLR